VFDSSLSFSLAVYLSSTVRWPVEPDQVMPWFLKDTMSTLCSANSSFASMELMGCLTFVFQPQASSVSAHGTSTWR